MQSRPAPDRRDRTARLLMRRREGWDPGPQPIRRAVAERIGASDIDAGSVAVTPERSGDRCRRPAVGGRSLLRSWTRPVFLAEYRHISNPSFPAPTWGSLVTRRHQYIEYDRNGTLIYREYYDLVHDPWELSNLFADGIPGNEPNAKLLHARLEALRHCIGDACRVRMADQRAVGFTNDHTYPIGSNPSLA